MIVEPWFKFQDWCSNNIVEKCWSTIRSMQW